MTGNSFRSNVLPEMSAENELAPRSLSDGPWRRVVALDGQDWGVYTDSGIRSRRIKSHAVAAASTAVLATAPLVASTRPRSAAAELRRWHL
jgi:hypothetical protein